MDKMSEENLFSYVIHHNGDPQYSKGVLSLGENTCKPRIRKQASVGDWIIATLSPNFLEEKGNFTTKCIKQHQDNCQQYLVYAMEITEKEKDILYSKNFYVFNNLLTMPKRFHHLIKSQQGHKRFPHKESKATDIKLMNSFIQWLKKHQKEKPYLFDFHKKDNVCKRILAHCD